MVSMTDAQLQHHIVPTGAFNLCSVYLYVLQDARKSNYFDVQSTANAEFGLQLRSANMHSNSDRLRPYCLYFID